LTITRLGPGRLCQPAEGLAWWDRVLQHTAIFAKLQVADRTQAILRARDAGLGHP
jgi:hypothetical protein